MVVDDEDKVLFCHIPKCGGSSIQEMLGTHNQDGPKHYTFPTWVIQRKENPKKYEEYFKFIVVRNPLDRFVSAYHYYSVANHEGFQDTEEYYKIFRSMASTPMSDWIEKNIPKLTIEYRRWVDPLLPKPIRLIYKGVPRVLALSGFRPQVTWLLSKKGRPLPIDLIGRLENLQDSLSPLWAYLGEQREIPVVNTSKHEDYRKLYTPKAEKIIRDLYKQDFKHLGY